MKRPIQKAVTPIFLFLILIVVGIAVYRYSILFFSSALPMLNNTNSYPTQDPLEDQIFNLVSKYKNGEVSKIDIASVTTFSWDRLYIIGPYFSPDDLDLMVGKTWRNNCPFPKTYNSDGYTLLVFSEKRNVVRCLDYPNYENYFQVPVKNYRDGFSKQDAHFILDESGRIVWACKD